MGFQTEGFKYDPLAGHSAIELSAVQQERRTSDSGTAMSELSDDHQILH